MSKARDLTPRVRYRCRACGLVFEPSLPGMAPCPRCQAVAGHEQVAVRRPGGSFDDR